MTQLSDKDFPGINRLLSLRKIRKVEGEVRVAGILIERKRMLFLNGEQSHMNIQLRHLPRTIELSLCSCDDYYNVWKLFRVTLRVSFQ